MTPSELRAKAEEMAAEYEREAATTYPSFEISKSDFIEGCMAMASYLLNQNVSAGEWVDCKERLPELGDNVEYSEDGITVEGTMDYTDERHCMLAGRSGGNGYFNTDGFATDGKGGEEKGLICDNPKYWRYAPNMVYIIQHRETMQLHGCFADRKQAIRYAGNGNVQVLPTQVHPPPQAPNTER